MYIDAKLAATLSTKHGIEKEILYSWSTHRSRMEESLSKAGIATPFAICAFWKEAGILYCVLLTISSTSE